jgi:hypothetical protein
MNGMRVLAIILMVLGGLGLAYGGFTYTKSSSTADLGPISVEIKDEERVNIPLWAGVVLLVAGGAMLMVPGRRVS